MDFYFGLAQTIGIHTLLGLSAYVLMLTGQLSLAQAGFFAIGAYTAGIFTVLFQWTILPALISGALIAGFFAFLIGFPSLRVRGLMLVVATMVMVVCATIYREPLSEARWSWASRVSDLLRLRKPP